MIRIAVTGGIACGKSLAASFMQQAGIPVCDADVVAHALMEPGARAYADVVAFFGDGILTVGGRIDRMVLGKVVFGDVRKLAQLNAMVHPRVKGEIDAWLSTQSAAGKSMAGAVIPLLYEAGMQAGWNVVICIACSKANQIARLRARGLSEADAMARMQAQMPVEEKARRADIVIWNDGGPEDLALDVRRALKAIEEKNR